MKTKIIIDIETPDTYNVYPEDVEDYQTKVSMSVEKN